MAWEEVPQVPLLELQLARWLFLLPVSVERKIIELGID
jgi:hypothetical protein